MKIKCKYLHAPITCWFENKTVIKNATFEGANIVDANTRIIDSVIGYATVIGPNGKMENCVVGRYCSIAPRFNSVRGTHPSRNFVSTCNLFYTTQKPRGFTYVNENRFKEYRYADEDKKKSVVIGHDVWIGDGVSVIDGVTIGNGAIIGAGALITKDVLPYSIVGGVPARIIRWRFDPEEIEFLLDLKWWNKGENWIKEYADLFTDIKKLKLVLKEGNNDEERVSN